MNRFEYVNVSSLGDAAALIDGNGSRLKAGGIDLLDQMKGHIIAPQRLVNILNIPNAGNITIDPKGLRIGPLATLAKVSSHAGIKASFPALADAVRSGRQSADSQYGNYRRQFMPATALLVFPRRGFRLSAKRRRSLFRSGRRKSLPRDF